MKKLLTIALAGLGLASLSTLSFAVSSLTITNATGLNSTSSINGRCTSKPPLGNRGITQACQSNTISGADIVIACGLGAKECDAVVYLSDNCDPSTAIGTAHFSMQQGLESFEATNPQYTITGVGTFNVTLQDLNNLNACPAITAANAVPADAVTANALTPNAVPANAVTANAVPAANAVTAK